MISNVLTAQCSLCITVLTPVLPEDEVIGVIEELSEIPLCEAGGL